MGIGKQVCIAEHRCLGMSHHRGRCKVLGMKLCQLLGIKSHSGRCMVEEGKSQYLLLGTLNHRCKCKVVLQGS